jgi:type IV pilus assembly protein PilB
MEAKKMDHSRDDQIKKSIANSLLFKGADTKVIQMVYQNLEFHSVPAGFPIFLENELNDKIYFIKSGEVEINYFQKDFNRMNQAAILKAGNYFAEFSVLTKGNTSASAIAHTECEILSLSGDRFIRILKSRPQIAKNLAVNLGNLIHQFVDSHSYITYFSKDQVEVNKDILRVLPVAQWDKLKCLPLSFKKDILSIATTSPHDSKILLYFNRFRDIKLEMHLIGEDDFIIQHESLCEQYKSSRMAAPMAKKEEEKDLSPDLLKKKVLMSNALFFFVPDEVKKQLYSHIHMKEYKAGERIFQAGTPSEFLYLVARGEVQLLKDGEEKGTLAQVSKLKQNDMIATISILLNQKHFLHAVANTKVTLLTIHKDLFHQLMGQSYFSIEVARTMAKMVQNANKNSGLTFFNEDDKPDFESLKVSIPWEIVKEHMVIPLSQDNKRISIGVVNPNGQVLYSTLGRYITNLSVNVVIITEAQFNSFIPDLKKYYEKNKVIDNVGASNADFVCADVIENIISEGTKLRASDIHFEPNLNDLVIRFRVDGVLRESDRKISYPNPGKEVISRLKVMSNMDITNRMIPQDGQIKEEIKGTNIFARASVIPLKNGEKIVLRLVAEKVNVPPLSSLTADKNLYNILHNVVKCRQGLFLITGPTGSGKTTSLYSILHELNSIELNIVTVEDPVELEIPGINQVEINNKQNLTFERALRSILRQDPDCIMIGEIRDRESAQIALEAAMTGHLVLSTIHTPGSLDVLYRLRDLGVEKSLIATGLMGAMSQRLVRKNCTHCLEEVPTTEGEKQFLKVHLEESQIPETLKKGKGCLSCNNTGYFGRLPVFEGWSNYKEIQDLIFEDSHLTEIKSSLEKKQNFQTLETKAIKMAVFGQTTLEEVKRVIGRA